MMWFPFNLTGAENKSILFGAQPPRGGDQRWKEPSEQS